MGVARSRHGRILLKVEAATARTPVAVRLAAWLFAALLAAPGSGATASDELVVVGHVDLAVESITTHSVRAIFAMRQRSWPDGQAARVFVLPDDHPVHVRFTKVVLGVFPHQLRLAWDRQVFSGSGQAPQRVNSEADMIERVATTPGAVGYLTKGAMNARVRIIPVD